MRGFLYLAATVLVAIAIAVGVSASFWNGPPEYGPPGYRFLASFPGKVTCKRYPPPIFRQPLMTEDCQSDHFPDVFQVEVFKLATLRAIARSGHGLFATGRGTVHATTVSYGQHVYGQEWPIFCSPMGKARPVKRQCFLTIYATDRTTGWSVTALETSAKVNPQAMKDFLESFQPIEG